MVIAVISSTTRSIHSKVAPCGPDARTRIVLRSSIGASSCGSWPASTMIRPIDPRMIGSANQRWRKNPSLNRLRQDLVATVEAKGGVLSAGQLADALLAARGSAQEEPLRSRLAAAVTRAAIEAESDLESPRIRLYRKHGRLLVATREEYAHWAARLGQAADRLGQRSRNAYARYEQGKAMPSVEKLEQLLKAIAPDQRIVWRIAA